MKPLDEEVFAAIKTAVERVARSFGIGGFMIVADIENGVAMFSSINTVTPARIGVEGKEDINFAAVAGAKFGTVLVRKKNTGKENIPITMFGEMEYTGGRISADGRFIYVFSGGPEKVDDHFMQVAERAHSEL